MNGQKWVSINVWNLVIAVASVFGVVHYLTNSPLEESWFPITLLIVLFHQFGTPVLFVVAAAVMSFFDIVEAERKMRGNPDIFGYGNGFDKALSMDIWR